jgi:Acetyltransferases, including N-acetylases of ribosomal proteins
MNIQGEKIVLRAIEPKDSSMLVELINDEETEYMLGGWSFPMSQKMHDEWINGLENNKNTLRCIIDVQGTGVGVVMLKDIDYKNGNTEVHIKMALTNARGKGYGSDALNTIVGYAFSELRLKCIYARVSKHNIASQKLFKKCMFNEEGVMNCRIFKKGKYIDIISFSKINENL